MLNIIHSIPPSIKRFSKNFEEIFGRYQLGNFQIYLSGLYLELKRKNLQAIDDSRLKGNYDSLHYFLSRSPWEEEKVNERRLKLIQENRRTRTTPRGAFIVDDTGCKKTGTHTEGAKPQRLGSEGRITNCNIVVTSHYVDEVKDFAIGLIEDAIQNEIQLKETLFDNWYLCERVVDFCQAKSLYWFSSLKRNDILYRNRRRRKTKKVKRNARKRIRRYCKAKEKLTVKELIMSLPAFYFHQMVKIYKHGKEQVRYIWGANFKLSFLKGTQRMVVSKLDPYSKDMDEIDVYVTNNLFLADKEIVFHASRRCKIEEFYKDAKENLGFDQYQVRTLKEIKKHWYFVFLAYIFLKMSNLKGAFQRVFKPDVSLNTLGDLLRTFRKLSFLHFWKWLRNHHNVLLQYLQVKEPIFA